MFRNLELKTKMLIMLIVPMLIIMLGITIYNYMGSREVLNQQIEQTAKYMTSSYVEQLELYFVNKEAIVNSTAKSLEDPNISDVAMIDFFKNLKASSSGIINVFAGFENGKYLEANGWTPPAGYNLLAREWYQKGINTDGLVYTDIYEDKGTGQLIVSIIKRIERNGKPVGVVGVDINLDDVKELTGKIKFGQSGYGYVIDNKGNFICHPTLKSSDNLFNINQGEYKEAARVFLSGEPRQQIVTFEGIERYDSSMPIGKTGWALVIDTPVSELYEGISKLGQISVISTILGLLLLTLVIFILADRVSKPIRRLSKLADRVASGDLTADINLLLNEVADDEVGQLTRSFYTMTKNLIKVIEQLKESAGELNGASQRLKGASTSATEIMQMIHESIEEMSERMETVSAATEKIALSSEEMTVSMHKLNNRAENGNELAKEIRQRVKTQDQETEKAHISSEKIIQDMQQILSAMEKTKAVDEIHTLADSMLDITEQAKILALIGELEANRADTNSTGFALLARKVGELAKISDQNVAKIQEIIRQVQQSSLDLINNFRELVKFTDEDITLNYDRIKEVREQYSSDVRVFLGLTQEFSMKCNQVLKTVGEVNLAIESVAATLSENALSTQEISRGTEYTVNSVMDISEAANDLSKMAEKLNKIVNQFKVD